MFSNSKFFLYILLVICWIACIVGHIMELYPSETIPIASMILIVGGIVIKSKDQMYMCGGS